MNYNFQDITTRLEVSHRGGGIEIDLTTLGFEGERMSAYQNYLGGGMLGRVCVNDTIRAYSKERTAQDDNTLDEISEALKRYYFGLTNPDEDTWEHQTYVANQSMPESGY